MYHSISEVDTEASHPYYQTNTPPAVFADHLKALHDEGYSAIPLSEAALRLRSGERLKRSVVITFDDGFADLIEIAFPIMTRFGFTGTVFLPTSYIGDEPMRFKNRLCLNWRQVRELHHSGVTFGSHSKTHRVLHSLPTAELEEELVGSKRVIEDKLGSAVDTFSYPYAFPGVRHSFKNTLRDLLLKAGYAHGVTTTIGTANPGEDTLFLKRLPINGHDDPAFFSSKLCGSYDWMGLPQYLVKSLKSMALAVSDCK